MHWIHVQVFFDARIFQLHKLEHEKFISNNYIMKFLSLEPDSLHLYVFTLVLSRTLKLRQHKRSCNSRICTLCIYISGIHVTFLNGILPQMESNERIKWSRGFLNKAWEKELFTTNIFHMLLLNKRRHEFLDVVGGEGRRRAGGAALAK